MKHKIFYKVNKGFRKKKIQDIDVAYKIMGYVPN